MGILPHSLSNGILGCNASLGEATLKALQFFEDDFLFCADVVFFFAQRHIYVYVGVGAHAADEKCRKHLVAAAFRLGETLECLHCYFACLPWYCSEVGS